MSSLGSPSPFFLAGKKAYAVDRSLRFNDNDNPKLTRTPSSGGNQKTWTLSIWLKRGNLGTSLGYIYRIDGSHTDRLEFDSSDRLFLQQRDTTIRITTQKFRDISAWYHIVIAMDTTQATADNRTKIYVNSEEVTSFDTKVNNTQDTDGMFNNTSVHNIGGRGSNESFDGYMAEINFVDGNAYDPSYFGETNATTGQWVPKEYTGGNYGTNGFYLNFINNSATTATTLGKDESGNSNNFTPNNFATGDVVKDSPTNNFATLNVLSKSSGVTTQEGNLYAQGSSAWRNIVANFHMSSGKWYWEIYIKQVGAAIYGIMPATRGNSRQDFYADIYTGTYSDEWGYRNNGYLYNSASANTSWGDSYTTGDILSFALDMDNGTLDIKKNNSTTGSQITGISTTKEYRAAFTYFTSGTQSNINFGQDSTFAGNKTAQGNTDGSGQGDFYYAPPSGYKALCSANLPDPTILLPNKHFDTLLWTGTSASHTLTGLNFQPDWFWAKSRSQAYHNTLMDSVRGADRQLWSNRTTAEQTDANFLTSFNSNGLTLGDNSSGTGATNTNGHTYVGWNWNAGDTDGKTYTVTVVSSGGGNKYRFDGFAQDAVTLDLAEGGTYIFNYPSAHPFRFSTTSDGTHGGGSEYTTGVTVLSSTSVQIVVAASAPQLHYFCTIHSGMGGAINTNSTLGSSNFDGSIQSVAKVNATAGFSIVTYTGTSATTATIGHGLGVTPKVIIVRERDASSQWGYFQTELGFGSKLNLDNTTAKGNSTLLNSTAPTSTVFSVRNTSSGDTLNNGGLFIAYLFSEVAAYSKFGEYTGNGNSDGIFLFLNFRPAFLILKRTGAAGAWYIYDVKRNTSNVMDKELNPDKTQAEATLTTVDFLSNGFKIRTNNSAFNASGSTYIYLAFAESPFKNARAR